MSNERVRGGSSRPKMFKWILWFLLMIITGAGALFLYVLIVTSLFSLSLTGVMIVAILLAIVIMGTIMREGMNR